MAWLDRWRLRRHRGQFAASLDRQATPDDLEHLRRFTRSRTGVEFFVEPETTATDTTVVAVAHDGEWTRRRVGSPEVARRLARELGVPVYEAQVVGYPPRMREWNRLTKERRRSEP